MMENGQVLKYIIYIDGPNFQYNLKNLHFPKFNMINCRLLKSHILLFQHIVYEN